MKASVNSEEVEKRRSRRWRLLWEEKCVIEENRKYPLFRISWLYSIPFFKPLLSDITADNSVPCGFSPDVTATCQSCKTVRCFGRSINAANYANLGMKAACRWYMCHTENSNRAAHWWSWICVPCSCYIFCSKSCLYYFFFSAVFWLWCSTSLGKKTLVLSSVSVGTYSAKAFIRYH